MPSRGYHDTAADLLEILSDRSDVADGVADARIVREATETATRVTTTMMKGFDSYRERRVPVSNYRNRVRERIPWEKRKDRDNRPSSFTKTKVPVVESNAEPVVCEGCAGEGSNMCQDCGGRSVLPCPNAKCDRGRVTCETCAGREQVVCPKCDGERDIVCERCSGSGSKTCKECRGDGSVTCGECKSGFLGSKPGGKVVCSDCNASGEKQTADGTVSCPSCTNGYRTCHKCNGTQSLPCGNCGRSGSFTCSNCNGAGENPCRECGRTGSVACDDCNDGTQTCAKCDGDTTVPCGCGNGRIQCDTCDGEGETVTARIGDVTYEVREGEKIESELGVEKSHVLDDSITDEETTLEVDGGEFVDGGNWVERKRVHREELPVRKVTYQYENSRYEVLDVGGNLIVESYPESETLTDFRSRLDDRRRRLRSELENRREYFRRTAQERADRIENYNERTNGLRSLVRHGFFLLSLVALYGAYLFILG